MNQESKIRKLQSIKTLAERGATDGEKQSAKALFDNLCKKWQIAPESLAEKKSPDFVDVQYSDGFVVRFFGSATYHDQPYQDGAIVRYCKSGTMQVLQQPQFQQTIIVSTFGGGWGGFFC